MEKLEAQEEWRENVMIFYKYDAKALQNILPNELEVVPYPSVLNSEEKSSESEISQSSVAIVCVWYFYQANARNMPHILPHWVGYLAAGPDIHVHTFVKQKDSEKEGIFCLKIWMSKTMACWAGRNFFNAPMFAAKQSFTVNPPSPISFSSPSLIPSSTTHDSSPRNNNNNIGDDGDDGDNGGDAEGKDVQQRRRRRCYQSEFKNKDTKQNENTRLEYVFLHCENEDGGGNNNDNNNNNNSDDNNNGKKEDEKKQKFGFHDIQENSLEEFVVERFCRRQYTHYNGKLTSGPLRFPRRQIAAIHCLRYENTLLDTLLPFPALSDSPNPFLCLAISDTNADVLPFEH